MASRLECYVEGEVVDGFESGKVTQSMDAFAAAFEVVYRADRLEGGDPVILEAGDAIEVRIADAEEGTLLAGYIDEDDSTLAARLRRKLSGRSKLGDLVDCSAFTEARRFRDVSIIDLATELTKDYGIAIYDRSEAVEPLERWAVAEGSTIANELTRAAKARGVVLLDEGGDLVIARAGEFSTTTRLEEGGDRVLSWRRLRSHSGRFSEYVVKTKRRRRDEDTGEPTTIRATVEDEGVRRLRRLVVQPYGDRGDAVERRAQLERNVRAGRSEKVVLEVAGWLTDEGKPWRPNTRVKVVSPTLGIDAVLLVVRATLLHGPELHRTELELSRPEAWDALVTYPTRGRGEAIR